MKPGELHTLNHALFPDAAGCSCSMRDILHCVICGRLLARKRDHVDTCSAACTRKLLALQRADPS